MAYRSLSTLFFNRRSPDRKAARDYYFRGKGDKENAGPVQVLQAAEAFDDRMLLSRKNRRCGGSVIRPIRRQRVDP